MKKKYDAVYFLEKFDKIHKSKWTTHRYKDGKKRCAKGHCGETWGRQTEESSALDRVLIQRSAIVNDGGTRFYFGNGNYDLLGDHPKERIMNALLLAYAGAWEEAFNG